MKARNANQRGKEWLLTYALGRRYGLCALEHFFKHAGTSRIAFLLKLCNHPLVTLQVFPMQKFQVLPLNFQLQRSAPCRSPAILWATGRLCRQ
jgi:hypothetical protein